MVGDIRQPRYPIASMVLSFASIAGAGYVGGWGAAALALLATFWGIVWGASALRLALYTDGGYIAALLPDGRGQHAVKRWRVGVVSAPANKVEVDWIKPGGGAA